MKRRVHITGAAGSGTTTLGRALSMRWQCPLFDTDDFFWLPTDPPYQETRPGEQRLALLREAIADRPAWISSGSLCGWGDPLIPLFDLVVFLSVLTEERLARLGRRESERFGADIAPGGTLHDSHVEFLIWAGSYDDGDATQRSRALHEAWLAKLPCPVLRLDGRMPLNDLVGAVESDIPLSVMPDSQTIATLAQEVRSGDRRALARAITLVESTRADHRAQADALLAELLAHTGKSIRLGITGVPGVGKSTFIERFGLHLIAAGHRVAVLAVDPSSKVSGGSILGDKTRMEELGRHADAFIRPTPAGTTLGGVARRTREVILLCEAAGFDVVIVETVGVGQSETTVSEMVDMFILLLLPPGGDELQGIKKGVVELADLVVVNKADGDMKAAATRAASEYRHALYLLRAPTPGWKVEVRTCSALTGEGIGEVWDTVGKFREAVGGQGIERRRPDQARAWLWNELGESLLQRLRSDEAVRQRLPALEADVTTGKITPGVAAAQLLALFTGKG